MLTSATQVTRVLQVPAWVYPGARDSNKYKRAYLLACSHCILISKKFCSAKREWLLKC